MGRKIFTRPEKGTNNSLIQTMSIIHTSFTGTEEGYKKSFYFLTWVPKIYKTIHYCSKLNVLQKSLKSTFETNLAR